jgi:hypothetical protein
MVGVSRRPWLALGVVVVPGPVHDHPKNPEKFLSKFDLDNRESPKHHVNKSMLAVNLMGVQHEDVVC